LGAKGKCSATPRFRRGRDDAKNGSRTTKKRKGTKKTNYEKKNTVLSSEKNPKPCGKKAS